MHFLSPASPPLCSFFYICPWLVSLLVQSNVAVASSSASLELNDYPNTGYLGYAAKAELSEGSLEPAVLGPGEVSSGHSDAMAQIPISTQDQFSVTSNPIVTAPQSPGNPAIDNTVTPSTSSILQLASSSSSLAVVTSQTPSTSSSSTLARVVTQLSNNALFQSPSSINHQLSSSFNNDALPTQLQQLSVNSVTHDISSVGYQSNPSSSLNSIPSHTLLSDPLITNNAPARAFPATTLAVIAGLLATQTIISGGTASSAVGLANATLAGIGVILPGASATPGEMANSAIGYGGNGIEIVQTFPTATLIVSSVPTAVISTVQGPVVTTSASMGIIAPGTSAMQHGWGNGSSVVTGSGNPTESVPGRTNVSTVFTGGTEGVNGWSNWLLGFGILVWEVGMLYWM